MSKPRVLIVLIGLIALIILFNVIVSLSFVSSNNYMWNYLKTEINENAGYNEYGYYVIPHIMEFGFQVSISHPIYINGTIANLGPIPEPIPNYPFMLFWISTIGNLVLITLALIALAFFLRNKASKQND